MSKFNQARTVNFALEGLATLASQGYLAPEGAAEALTDFGMVKSDKGLWTLEGLPFDVEVIEQGKFCTIWRTAKD